MFKEGDKVKVKRNCSGCIIDVIYTLHQTSSVGRFRASKDGMRGCSCETNWILVNDIDVRKLNASIIKKSKKTKAEAKPAESIYSKITPVEQLTGEPLPF
jgi:hypothetical protein